MIETNTVPIELTRRPAEEVPAATISSWAKECGLSLTATQIEMLALQWRVSLLVAIAEETIKVDRAARQAGAQDAYEQAANLLFRHVYHADFEQCNMDECGSRCKEITGTADKIRALAAAEAGKEGDGR